MSQLPDPSTVQTPVSRSSICLDLQYVFVSRGWNRFILFYIKLWSFFFFLHIKRPNLIKMHYCKAKSPWCLVERRSCKGETHYFSCMSRAATLLLVFCCVTVSHVISLTSLCNSIPLNMKANRRDGNRRQNRQRRVKIKRVKNVALKVKNREVWKDEQQKALRGFCVALLSSAAARMYKKKRKGKRMLCCSWLPSVTRKLLVLLET